MDIQKILKEIAENEHENFRAFKERLTQYCIENEKAFIVLFRLLRNTEVELSDCLNCLPLPKPNTRRYIRRGQRLSRFCPITASCINRIGSLRNVITLTFKRMIWVFCRVPLSGILTSVHSWTTPVFCFWPKPPKNGCGNKATLIRFAGVSLFRKKFGIRKP